MTINQTQATFRIYLFGQPRFELGSASFSFKAPPKTLPLLAYLLIHRGRQVSRDTLAFSFWPDASEEEAFAQLRRHLNYLKNALPNAADERWVIATHSAIQWNTESAVWLDVDEFEHLVNSETARAAAVELYTGDLLEPFYDDWILPWRERLRTKYLEALGALVIERRRKRQLAAAVDYTQRILAVDPWREDAVRQLMATRYEMGDRSGALRSYEEFGRRLREEMGVEPMPETAVVRDSILHNAALEATVAVPVDESERPLSIRRAALPLVGREHELEQLRAIWTRTARGFGGTLFIGGEAGIGKTRLAEELRLIAESEGARVIAGRTSQPESFPYQCFAEALSSAHALVMSLGLAASHLASLARLVPTLSAEHSAAPRVEPPDSELDQQKLFAAFERCFSRLSLSRPAVVLMEDLHWAGRATIKALEFVAQRISSVPILLVLTYRSDDIGRTHPFLQLRRTLLEQQRGSAIALGHLSADAVRELIGQLPEVQARAGSEVASTLYTESEGNPLLLLHLVRAIVESPQQSSIAPRVGGPANIRATIIERIERLPTSVRMLAEAAAVAGRLFDIDVVRDVIGWDEADLFDALDVLLDRHFVRELSTGRRFSYGFTHHLVQTALYDRIPAQTRNHRHRRYGRVIEDSQADLGRELSGEIARHYDLGGAPGRAATQYLEAGRQATSVHALEEALGYLSRGLEIADDSHVRTDLLLQREIVHARRGDRNGQRLDLSVLDQRSVESSDGELSCEVLYRRSRLAHALGDRSEEACLVGLLRKKAQTMGSKLHLARAQTAAADLATQLDRFDEARTYALAALGAWEEQQNTSEQIECLCLLAHIALHQGAVAESEPYMQRAQGLAASTGQAQLAAAVFWSRAGSALLRHQFGDCIELSRTAADLYRAIGDREGEADATAREASALSRLERYEDALAANERAAIIFEAIEKRQGVATALVNAGVISLRLGDLRRARELLGSAHGLFTSMHDRRGEIVCELNSAFACLVGGDPQAAKSMAQSVLVKTREVGLKAMEAQALATLGAAERDSRDLDHAIEHMKEGIALERMLERTSDIANDLADLALAYMRKGDVEAAKLTVEELLLNADASTVGSLWPQYLFWVSARVFHAAGDRKRAKALLERSAAAYRGAFEACRDPGVRDRFSRLPFNQQIEAAARKGRWPKN